MKALVLTILVLVLQALTTPTVAQCSICTKTAQQLGEKPAKGLNAGIIYLAAVPFAIAGYIFYRWRKQED